MPIARLFRWMTRPLLNWFLGLCLVLVDCQRELDETARLGERRARLMEEIDANIKKM